MIVNLATWYVNVAIDRAADLGCDVCVVADKQTSLDVLDRKVEGAVSGGRVAYVNWRWYRPVDQCPEWFSAFAGGSRSDVESADASRRQFFELIASHFPEGPLLAPSGPVNDPARSVLYASDMVTVRDASFSGREVLVSVTLDRNGLQDASVLSQVTPPRGVDGVFLTVADTTSYPSAWNRNEWLAWLRLTGSLARAGYRVVLDCADARGLTALGVADLEYSTGNSQAERQVPLDPGSPGGAGASAPVDYFSAPLLVPVHGENVAVDPTARAACENHSSCGVFGGLPFAPQEATFDPNWLGAGTPVGNQISNRLARHLTDIHVVETWIRNQTNRADAVEASLEHAYNVGTSLGLHAYKTDATRNELTARLEAFREVRGLLGI